MMYLGRDVLGWHYLLATVVAVEVTLGHNFCGSSGGRGR